MRFTSWNLPRSRSASDTTQASTMSMQSRFGLLIARLLKLLNRQAKPIGFLTQLVNIDILDVFAEPPSTETTSL